MPIMFLFVADDTSSAACSVHAFGASMTVIYHFVRDGKASTACFVHGFEASNVTVMHHCVVMVRQSGGWTKDWLVKQCCCPHCAAGIIMAKYMTSQPDKLVLSPHLVLGPLTHMLAHTAVPACTAY